MPRYNQGFFKPRNPKKYKGDPNNIVFRSGWEFKLMFFMDNNDSFIQWSSEEIVIPYISPIDGKRHRYFVDFWCKFRNAKGEIEEWLIEVKPEKQTREPEKKKRITKAYINEVFTWGVNEAKWEAARKYCDAKGWKFKIFTEKELFGK